jgi:peptide-methionine (R)-S-oxide reductase
MVQAQQSTTRRRWLTAVPLGLGGVGAIYWLLGKSFGEKPSTEDVSVIQFDDAGKNLGPVITRKVFRSDAEWREGLSEQQFFSTRRGTTDTPFTGTYYQLHEAGLYRCICCATALFSSQTKFDSSTGWPAFWAPIAAENITTKTDLSLPEKRTEVLCRLCDAHLGHVFDDGPPPTHLRYCINESALRFVAG